MNADTDIVANLEEKMHTAYQLACKLTYSTIDGTSNLYFDVRENWEHGTNGEIFSWSDGLYHEYLSRRIEGRCSIKAMIDFDIEKFEAKVDKDIQDFTDLLKLYGEPRILSKEELISRGYKR